MKTTAISSLVLLASLGTWINSAHAQLNANPKFADEITKQESIYRAKSDESYTVNRSLADYAGALTAGFDSSLANLGPQDRWLDIGAGEGQAILDYYTADYDRDHPEARARRGTKAQAIAMSIEDRRTPAWTTIAAMLDANQTQYLFSRRLREYSLKELGQFQLITDVIGGFSYATDLSLFVEKVLGFLQVNGSFYTVLQDVNSDAGTNQPYYANAPYLTEIKKADGSDVKVCSWLKRISCVEVTCELKTSWKPPVESFRVRKICNEVVVPALEPVHYAAGTPPERRFKLKE
ncbi:MAG: hypothetical protein ABIS45_08105 [Burkholderiales bacterium]